MHPLEGHTVLAWGGTAEGALARFFQSLGAVVTPALPNLENAGAASFVIEDLGLQRLEALGLTRAAIEKVNPALVHVSVTAFGSHGPRATWKAGELVVSALGGVLRLTGDPDRAPVKEALDACLFHADMVAAAGAMAAHYSRGRTGSWPACGCFSAGGCFQPQCQRRVGVAVRSAPIAPRRRCGELWQSHGTLYLATGGWVVFSFAHDRQIRCASQSGAIAVDG